MPGFFADSTDDPRYTANMGLFANMMRGDLPAGLLAHSAVMSPEAQSRRDISKLTLEDLKAQIEAHKAKTATQQGMLARQDAFLGGAPAGQGAGFTGGGDQGGVMALARKFGIPEQAIHADVLFNGGKKISELLAKHGARDMQVTNGYAYDKNNTGPGFMPSLSTSNNGQTSMTRIGPDGLPVVSAPQGAMETYGGYRNADESAKANFDLQTVTPQGQNPQITTRGNLLRTPQVSGTQIPQDVQSQRDQGRQTILQQELVKAQGQLAGAMQNGDQAAAMRAQTDIAALQREMGGKSAKIGLPLQSEEEKLRGQKGVEGDAATNSARAKDVKTAQQFLSVANQAMDVLKQKPTGSGFGSMVDSAAGLVGYATPGSISAQQLKAIGGWLTANVPRMEGPQSNFDVGNYQRMAADVGNDMLPIARRQKALGTIQQMMQGIVESGGNPAELRTGSWEAPQSAVSKGGWSAVLKK